MVKAVVFWIVTVCLVTATVAGMLVSWEGIPKEIALRLFWSALTLAAGSFLFLGVNLLFGDLGREFLGSRQSPSEIDPAFSDRLRKAKAMGQAEAESKSG